MTKLRSALAAVGLFVSLAASPAFAQSSGSFAGDFTSVNIIPTVVCQTTDTTLSCVKGGTAFLGATIKMPSASGKNLLIGGSLQTSLLTSTSATGGKGNQTSTATGSIVVTPTVTGPHGQAVPVFPPHVIFDEREQQLTANLSGCITNPGATGPVITCTTPETIALVLSTTSAHSFNFIAQNQGAGVYTVTLNIGVTANATSTSAGFNSNAVVAVGVGSLTAQIVQVQTPFNSLCFDLVNGTSC